MAVIAPAVSGYSLRNVDEDRMLPDEFEEIYDAFLAAREIAKASDACVEIVRADGTLALRVNGEVSRGPVAVPRDPGRAVRRPGGSREPDPSLRHVTKLLDHPANCDPIYQCQLCRRRGALDQLMSDECPARSGAMKKIAADEADQGTA